MQHTASLTLRLPVTASATSGTAWLRRLWGQLTLDADEAYLRQACDLADLERRLRRLERGSATALDLFHPGA